MLKKHSFYVSDKMNYHRDAERFVWSQYMFTKKVTLSDLKRPNSRKVRIFPDLCVQQLQDYERHHCSKCKIIWSNDSTSYSFQDQLKLTPIVSKYFKSILITLNYPQSVMNRPKCPLIVLNFPQRLQIVMNIKIDSRNDYCIVNHKQQEAES